MIIIGHRGAMGYAPENTLKSFRKALELNIDMTELDIYVCKSGELVVIHDDKIDRTTNGIGYVSEKTYDELKELDAGEGEKIPLLSEVLDCINRKIKINIELKGEGTAQPMHEMIEDYVKNRGWKYEDFVISSFNHHELQAFKERNKKVKTGALLVGIPITFSQFAEDLGANSIHPCVEFINQEFVDDAHKRGLDVYVWTVNDYDDIEKMKKLGVDGIFSNFPDRI